MTMGHLGGSERVVGTLGIGVSASDSDNMGTFKGMTVDTGVFTCKVVVTWLKGYAEPDQHIMYKGLGDRAEDHALKLEDDERNQGWMWLDAKLA